MSFERKIFAYIVQNGKQDGELLHILRCMPEAPSSMCATAAAPRKLPNCCTTKTSPPISTMPDWTMRHQRHPPTTLADGRKPRHGRHQCIWKRYRQTGCAIVIRMDPPITKPTSRKQDVPEGTDKKPTRSSFTPSRIRQHCTNAFPTPFLKKNI